MAPAEPGAGQITLRPEEVFHNAARTFLQAQISTLDVLDTKASAAFGVGSTVLPVTFALLNLSNTHPPVEAKGFLCVALGAYIVLLICAGRASFLRALEFRPDIATLGTYSATYPGPALQEWVATEYLASIEANRPTLNRKARWVGAAVAALYIEGLLLAGAALFTILS